MNETILITILSFGIGGGLIWFLMKRKIKQVNEILSDKKVVINELANYAEKINKTHDDVVVKKSTKKKETKKTTTPKSKKTKKTNNQ